MLRQIKHGVCDTAVQINKQLRQNYKIEVSDEAVRKHLRKAGLSGRAKVKKPLLKDKHKKLRLEFARKYQNFDLEDWAKVIWSDETKINRFGSDGRQWMWKRKGESLQDRHVQPTLKFGGGNIMLWGCMSMEGVGECHRIYGRMTSLSYIDILNRKLQLSLEKWGKTKAEVIFQQDNDPKHTAKVTLKWFADNNYQLLDWPPQSPDLNPIEQLWGILKKSLAEYETEAENLEELWSRVSRAWTTITRDQCFKLISSMPNRIQAVIKAKGGYTKY